MKYYNWFILLLAATVIIVGLAILGLNWLSPSFALSYEPISIEIDILGPLEDEVRDSLKEKYPDSARFFDFSHILSIRLSEGGEELTCIENIVMMANNKPIQSVLHLTDMQTGIIIDTDCFSTAGKVSGFVFIDQSIPLEEVSYCVVDGVDKRRCFPLDVPLKAERSI